MHSTPNDLLSILAKIREGKEEDKPELTPEQNLADSRLLDLMRSEVILSPSNLAS